MFKHCFLFIMASLLLTGCASKTLSPALELTFIDVGEGDSTLIKTASGTAILIDTGSAPGIGKIQQTLSNEKISQLEALIITHPDLDHIGNVFSLKDQIEIKRIFDNGQAVTKEGLQNDFYRWYAEEIRSLPQYQVLRSPQSLHIDDLELQILWPPKGDLDSNWNKNSLILGFKYKGKKVLLMADALKATEEALLPIIDEYHSVDIVKAGHHGSIHTGSTEFISMLAPAQTIVSVNHNNIRGYPDKKVLEEYAKYAQVYRTDLNGNIKVSIYSDGTIKTITEKNSDR